MKAFAGICLIASLMTTTSAFAENTTTNPAWGHLDAYPSLSMTSNKVIESEGFADSLGALSVNFTGDLSLNYVGDSYLGKQYEIAIVAKGDIVKSGFRPMGGDSSLNDELARAIPESIRIDHSQFVSRSQMVYPFTPYCTLELKNPFDMTSDAVSIANSKQAFKLAETRVYRYQLNGNMVAVFRAFNLNKVSGKFVELSCYAPTDRAMSKIEVLSLLQNIFGNTAAVSLAN